MLSKRLKYIRKMRKLSQEELANKINSTKSTISNYETGYSSPSNETLSDLADVLNTTTDYLLGRTEDPDNKVKVSVAGQDIQLTQDEYKVFKELKKHSIAFHDLQSNPEKKIKQLIKMWEVLKLQLEDVEDNDKE